jgi:hypothetical protein
MVKTRSQAKASVGMDAKQAAHMERMREAAILARRRKHRERLEKELREVEAKLTSSDEDAEKKRCTDAAVELQRCAKKAKRKAAEKTANDETCAAAERAAEERAEQKSVRQQ